MLKLDKSKLDWRPHVQRINEKKKGVTDFSHYHGGIEMEHEDFNVKTLKVRFFLFFYFFIFYFIYFFFFHFRHSFFVFFHSIFLLTFFFFFSKVFRLQDYCWENQGYSLLNRYYPGAGDNFDDLFTETLNLTDYTSFFF